jgi:hypothetical protein
VSTTALTTWVSVKDTSKATLRPNALSGIRQLLHYTYSSKCQPPPPPPTHTHHLLESLSYKPKIADVDTKIFGAFSLEETFNFKTIIFQFLHDVYKLNAYWERGLSVLVFQIESRWTDVDEILHYRTVRKVYEPFPFL